MKVAVPPATTAPTATQNQVLPNIDVQDDCVCSAGGGVDAMTGAGSMGNGGGSAFRVDGATAGRGCRTAGKAGGVGSGVGGAGSCTGSRGAGGRAGALSMPASAARSWSLIAYM